MVKDEADSSCQVLAGGLCAGAVNKSEGIIAFLGEFQCMREAVLHGTHIGKGSSRIADGKLLSGRALEEEQSGIRLGWVSSLFHIGVDVIEDGLAVRCPLSQSVHDLHRFVRIDMAVVGQLKFFQRVAAVIVVICREQQPPEAVKRRIVDYGFNGRSLGKWFGHVVHAFCG